LGTKKNWVEKLSNSLKRVIMGLFVVRNQLKHLQFGLLELRESLMRQKTSIFNENPEKTL
jgi:hypothetical protein